MNLQEIKRSLARLGLGGMIDALDVRLIDEHQSAPFLGRPGTGKSHLAQAVGHAAILKGYRVAYREAHILLEEIAEAELEGRRPKYMKQMMKYHLLIVDHLGMRKLSQTAAEELLEVIMRRHERASCIITSNRPVNSTWRYWAAGLRSTDHCPLAVSRLARSRNPRF